jgi:hypothetical protein
MPANVLVSLNDHLIMHLLNCIPEKVKTTKSNKITQKSAIKIAGFWVITQTEKSPKFINNSCRHNLPNRLLLQGFYQILQP